MKIEIKNLIKAFNNDFNILNDITMSFDLNEAPVVILGEEGSGKTTFLNIIAGLEQDYSGEVFLDGINRREVYNKENNISYIMAKPVFFENKSVLKNLLYVYKVKDKKFNKDDAISEIKEVVKEFGLIECLSKKVKKCLLFEKKLVALARFYLKKSKLLIMDEPLEGLIEIEKSCLINYTYSLVRKLSSGLVVAEKGENKRYFNDVGIFNIDAGCILKEKCD